MYSRVWIAGAHTPPGKFFAASTDIYAAKTGVSKESATATFATIFTFIFLGFEFGLKILTSLVSADAHVTLYIIFTVRYGTCHAFDEQHW